MKLRFLVSAALLSALFVAGCGSDSGSAGGPGTPGPDATPDSSDTPDASDEAAAEASLPDAPVPDSALPDAPAEDGTTQDAALDAAEDQAADAAADDAPATGRPPGQCKSDSDCEGSQTCTMTAPGGLCQGCGAADDCPDPLKFECYVGTCQRTCGDDPDCPEGFECKSVGRCGLIACSSSCPAPYVCDGGYCRRPACAASAPECPTGMACGQDDICVEQ